jgi:VanZ family protein
LILILTLAPLPEGSGRPFLPGLDKIAHAGMFGLLALALARDMRPFRGGKALLGCAAALALALGTESAQAFIPGRGADLLDGLADLAGFALGLAAARLHGLRRVKIC